MWFLKILEGSILLKGEIIVVLCVSLAGLSFSIKTNSFSILQLINLIVKIAFVCVCMCLHPLTEKS